MVHCGACGKFLSPTGAATCSTCPIKYHRACLAIAEKANISKDWVCPTCKKNIRKGDNTQTPVKGICENVDSEVSSLSGIVTGTSQHDSRHADEGATLRDSAPDQLNSIQEFRREFAECMLEMRAFRKEMELLRESFAAVTLRMDGMEERLETLEQRLSVKDDDRVKELERNIVELKMELNDRDQEALLSDLEIGHLPEEKGENVFHTVAVLAGKLGVTLEQRDVVFAERLGAPPVEANNRARRIVVRLARRQLRDDLLRAARVRRTGLASNSGPRVFLNERLTRPNRLLFHSVREECRRLQWRYTWTKRGRIYARQGDGKPAFQFRSDGDLSRAFGSPGPVTE